MALRALVFSILLISTLGVQQAFATTIDFDTFPDGTVPADRTRITTQYEPCGVSLFTTDDPAGPEIRTFGASPPNVLAPTGLSFDFIGDIGIQFSSPVSGEVSLLGMDVRHAGLRLEAFDSTNALVSSDTIPVNFASITETMTVSGSNIVRVFISQIVPQTGGFVDGYSIDDLVFPGPACELQINVVGGKIIPIESASLILAGVQSFSWMIPVVLSGLGIGLFVFTKSENS